MPYVALVEDEQGEVIESFLPSLAPLSPCLGSLPLNTYLTFRFPCCFFQCCAACLLFRWMSSYPRFSFVYFVCVCVCMVEVKRIKKGRSSSE
jgi:hypothetical protein